MTAMKSKDLRTKVGTVIVDDENDILTTGFNGFPRGISDALDRQAKMEKVKYTLHAEANACLSAARKGVSIRGAKCYVTWAPCEKCALMLIQSGIKEVIFHQDNKIGESWQDSVKFGEELLKESGVIYTPWSGELITPKIFVCGEVIQLNNVS